MKAIALTGTIATGKSTVMGQFASLRIPTLNADAVVHQLLAARGAAVAEVAKHFPQAKIGEVIDRSVLGDIVFSDVRKLKQLESILHPMVRQAERAFLKRQRYLRRRLAVVEIPLLFETNSQRRFCQSVLTYATPYLIHTRAAKRPRMNVEKLKQILSRQLADDKKRARADIIVYTGLGKAVSMRGVKRIWLSQISPPPSPKPNPKSKRRPPG